MPTPLTLYRVSVFYEQRGDRSGGWTTNFWNSTTSEEAIVTRTNKLVELLQNVTGGGCNVVKARYAVVPGFRVADEIKYTYAGTIGSDELFNADYQTTAVGVRLVGPGKYGVNVWLSGNDDFAVRDAGRLAARFKSSRPWKALQKYLVQGGDGWVLRVKNKGRVSKAVSSITATGTVTATAHGFDGTNLVTISRIKGEGRPRGSWRISNITTNTFDLIGYANANAPNLKTRYAIAREDVFVAVAIEEVKAVRATSHVRGKPTDLLTGKKKKVS